MEFRTLGNIDIKVSVIAMGCWPIVGDSTWGTQNEKDSIDCIEAALDSGITFFDTAEAYGNGYSEEILGKVLPSRRDKVVIASKFRSSCKSGEELISCCDAALERLKTDYMDLYQIHWPTRSMPFAEAAEALGKLQEQGKIRAVGVSNFGVVDLDAYLEVGRAESNQLAYSLLFRAIEHEVRPKCEAHQVGILCYSPLAQGLLTGKFASADEVPEGRARTRMFSKDRPQSKHTEEGCEVEMFEALSKIRGVAEQLGEPMADVALAWLIHQPIVTSVLAGFRNVEQAVQNASAGSLTLSDDVVAELSAATDPVKEKLGTNTDMWMSESRMK